MEAKALKYSIDEYLALESQEQIKYEFYNGDVYALAGASTNHNRLSGNIFFALKSELAKKASSCEVFNSDQKLHLTGDNAYVYPDCTVYCEDKSPSDQDKNSLTKPKLVVEVLSKGTANRDRGSKCYKYKQVQSLRQYLLIEQYEPAIDIFTRKDDTDLWAMTRVEGLDKSFELTSIQTTISMSELYKNVNFIGLKSDLQ